MNLGPPAAAGIAVDPRAARDEERWALTALGTVGVITMGWWALALWPMPETTPEWLVRTREVCFGNRRESLPPPGGWILLLSQPVGMLAVVLTVWGGALRRGLRGVLAGPAGRSVVAGAAVLLLAGVGGVGWRVATAGTTSTGDGGPPPGRIVALDDPAPALRLVDQRGDTVSLEQFRERAVLVTFAFAHCEAICPTLVRAALETGRRSADGRPVVLVVTLDPWRDTPSRLPSIAAGWDLGPDEYVLSGSVEAVEASLNVWKVPRVRNLATGEVIHPSVTYVVGPGGELAYLTDGSAAGLERALAHLTAE